MLPWKYVTRTARSRPFLSEVEGVYGCFCIGEDVLSRQHFNRRRDTNFEMTEHYEDGDLIREVRAVRHGRIETIWLSLDLRDRKGSEVGRN